MCSLLCYSCYVCIPRSFLVINVCNEGKILCAPCIFKCYGALLEAYCNLSVDNSLPLYKGASMRNKDSITIFAVHSKFDVTAEHFFGVVVTSVCVAEQKMCTLCNKTEMEVLE